MSLASKTSWFLFLFVTISINAAAQWQTDQYLKDIAVADSFFRQKQYCEAARSYRYAFESNNIYTDIYLLLCAQCWQNCGEQDSALADLRRLVFMTGFSNSKSIVEYFKGSNIQRSKKYKDLLSYSKRLGENNMRPFRKDVAKLLDSLYIADQTGRSLSTEISVPKISTAETVSTLDSLYQLYGWLSRSEAGVNGSHAQFLIIQHAAPQVMFQWRRRLKKGVKQGFILPPDYATFRDRLLIQNKKRQIYGTQSYFDTTTGSYQPLPIRNQKQVDRRRLKVGLNRLKAELRLINHSNSL